MEHLLQQNLFNPFPAQPVPLDQAGKDVYGISSKSPHKGKEAEAPPPVSKLQRKMLFCFWALQKSVSLLEEPRAAWMLREPGPRYCQQMLQRAVRRRPRGSASTISGSAQEAGTRSTRGYKLHPGNQFQTSD